MRVACRPRISGRCLWSGAGEGSAAEHFDWLLSGCCLERTGSDLAERKLKYIFCTRTNTQRNVVLAPFLTLILLMRSETHDFLWHNIHSRLPQFLSLVYLSLFPECGPQGGWSSASLPPESSAPSPVCPLWHFECCSSCTCLSPDCT